jgi:hypothetical protein
MFNCVRPISNVALIRVASRIVGLLFHDTFGRFETFGGSAWEVNL